MSKPVMAAIEPYLVARPHRTPSPAHGPGTISRGEGPAPVGSANGPRMPQIQPAERSSSQACSICRVMARFPGAFILRIQARPCRRLHESQSAQARRKSRSASVSFRPRSGARPPTPRHGAIRGRCRRWRARASSPPRSLSKNTTEPARPNGVFSSTIDCSNIASRNISSAVFPEPWDRRSSVMRDIGDMRHVVVGAVPPSVRTRDQQPDPNSPRSVLPGNCRKLGKPSRNCGC